jgi:hypothetical protein
MIIIDKKYYLIKMIWLNKIFNHIALVSISGIILPPHASKIIMINKGGFIKSIEMSLKKLKPKNRNTFLCGKMLIQIWENIRGLETQKP